MPSKAVAAAGRAHAVPAGTPVIVAHPALGPWKDGSPGAAGVPLVPIWMPTRSGAAQRQPGMQHGLPWNGKGAACMEGPPRQAPSRQVSDGGGSQHSNLWAHVEEDCEAEGPDASEQWAGGPCEAGGATPEEGCEAAGLQPNGTWPYAEEDCQTIEDDTDFWQQDAYWHGPLQPPQAQTQGEATAGVDMQWPPSASANSPDPYQVSDAAPLPRQLSAGGTSRLLRTLSDPTLTRSSAREELMPLEHDPEQTSDPLMRGMQEMLSTTHITVKNTFLNLDPRPMVQC